MNKSRILGVAHAILIARLPGKGKRGYNQSIWRGTAGEKQDNSGHNCKTVFCIGGWAVSLYGRGRKITSENARKLLGLTSHQADALFSGTGGYYNFGRSPTNKQRGGAGATPSCSYGQSGLVYRGLNPLYLVAGIVTFDLGGFFFAFRLLFQ